MTPPQVSRGNEPSRAPINYWILFCEVGQINRCRAPRPCVLWRGESFSSPAGAKHLSAPPRLGQPAPPPLYPSPGHPHVSLVLAQSRALRHRVCRHPTSARRAGAGTRGISAGCWLETAPVPQPALVLASASCAERRGERCTAQHFYSRLIFRGKSTDLVRPKHNKG